MDEVIIYNIYGEYAGTLCRWCGEFKPKHQNFHECLPVEKKEVKE